ncbi:MAG: Bug family tripartite tricarboxylate transporter substrate binding protein [Burkholderiales bacterium]
MVKFSAFVLLFIAASAAQAQTASSTPTGNWPAKPIRVIYPFAAGGVGDNSFRIIAPAIEAKLGQRFVIEARAGAAGNIAAQEVARAAPDGYTLLMPSTSVLAINPHLFKNLGFDPLGSFDMISTYSESAPVTFINANIQARTLKEFVAYAKANPGKLNYGSPGVGSPSHLVSELLSQLASANMTHIAYKGTPPMMQGILANDVQMISTTLSAAIAHVKTGRLRVLAAGSRERLPDGPDVPTATESGFPELTASNWWGLVAPKGTPAPIIERLAAETRAALADPATRNRIVEMSMTPLGSTPAQFTSLVKEELVRWKTVVERGGIKGE